mmetsp:Transcript_5672/g.10638  ORF Transcript_5672/g.10638 Transcript_5672/m.10638 type:complete len:102 (+) Transcript_5672:766-1071(+)|eukprot:CAMPEP_0172837314 /NCGR_PEP_ID=MMETSP1075-20121228/27104_1 /TAXON_ID=2916 /ORGANISM="Ceratium fusus, Strain PA161109" /LENGTH=101 /DNA_ID=CAMNT_0013680681 /DNA_START=736 /DNA_END=1041 /DNA_ORIENTATION=+
MVAGGRAGGGRATLARSSAGTACRVAAPATLGAVDAASAVAKTATSTHSAASKGAVAARPTATAAPASSTENSALFRAQAAAKRRPTTVETEHAYTANVLV